ncbi:MAG: D-glycerate dehydrogenase [Gemmatimonadetes bacterium]|nr:D-glycerate dehydrogenase [Gemmatimonadota bacterium]
MSKLQVLFIPHEMPDLADWSADLLQALEGRFEIRRFDREAPLPPQFAGIEAMVDQGSGPTREMIDAAAAAGVRFLQLQTNGLDHVDLDYLRGKGLMTAHCPGHLSAVALAQNAMMFILMLAGRYREAQVNFAQGPFFMPRGREVVGMTLGIVGLGASGTELARRAKPFGMRIEAIDVREIDAEVLDEIRPDFLGGPDDLDAMVGRCDFLSCHLHLTDETRHIIDARRIGLMKPTACYINVCRGGLADEEALYAALMEGRIGGAGLDAFAQEPPDPTLPVFQLPNVVVLPHTAGGTDGTSRKRAAFAAGNLARFARGEEPQALVVGGA